MDLGDGTVGRGNSAFRGHAGRRFPDPVIRGVPELSTLVQPDSVLVLSAEGRRGGDLLTRTFRSADVAAAGAQNLSAAIRGRSYDLVVLDGVGSLPDAGDGGLASLLRPQATIFSVLPGPAEEESLAAGPPAPGLDARRLAQVDGVLGLWWAPPDPAAGTEAFDGVAGLTAALQQTAAALGTQGGVTDALRSALAAELDREEEILAEADDLAARQRASWRELTRVRSERNELRGQVRELTRRQERLSRSKALRLARRGRQVLRGLRRRTRRLAGPSRPVRRPDRPAE